MKMRGKVEEIVFNFDSGDFAVIRKDSAEIWLNEVDKALQKSDVLNKHGFLLWEDVGVKIEYYQNADYVKDLEKSSKNSEEIMKRYALSE